MSGPDLGGIGLMKSSRRRFMSVLFPERRDRTVAITSALVVLTAVLWFAAASVAANLPISTHNHAFTAKGQLVDVPITEHANSIINVQVWVIVGMFGMLQTLFGFIVVYVLKDIKGSIAKLFDISGRKVDTDYCVRCEARLRGDQRKLSI